jgi:O-antigen ligase
VYTFVFWGEFGHAHNAYLDLWSNLGFVGCGLFAASLIVAGRRMFVRLTETKDAMGVFYPSATALMLILAMSAYIFPQHGSIFWVIYSATMFYLSPIGIRTPIAPALAGRLRVSRPASPRLATQG